MSMTRRTLVLLFSVEALLLAFLTFALLDRRMHLRIQSDHGVNQWGYRDEPHGSKDRGELRVALVGGSSAFEAALPYPPTLAGNLFIELRAAGAHEGQQYSVVNLSEPRAGADSYADAIRDYAFLDPDAVCVFDGYDMPAGPPPHGRRRSLVFRSTGYLPVLPASLLGRPGWMSDADGGVAEWLQDGRGGPADVSCAGASAGYCDAMAAAVRSGLRQGRPVIVVSPPSVSARHARQQRSLAAALAREFGRNAQFMYLDLGTSMDLSDPVHSPDGLHRTNIGNHVVGQRIATTLLKWAAFMDRRRP